MDLIIGGGTHGLSAVRYCLREKRPAIVVDPDHWCRVGRFLSEGTLTDEGIRLIQGGIPEAYTAFSRFSPNRIFPTAPVHVAAGLCREALGLHDWPAGLPFILRNIPEEYRIGRSGADMYISLLRDRTCVPDCPSPDRCPVTGEDRCVPLVSRIRSACPGAVILESVQLAPGLGAIRGPDLREAIGSLRAKHEIYVGTACRCHGIITALKRDDRTYP